VNEAEWVLLIARVQFALTMAMHIVLAALTMGLAPLLVWFEAQWLWQKNTAARDALHFWIKIFSLTVAVGAVSGVVMEFQFGTHWAAFSQQTGGIIGPFLFYEVLTAFFLESALTGVMLFGFGRIPPHVHFAVTCMVAFGALLSAFWILAANSWMQTPVGFTQDDAGHFIPESIFLLLKAPSFPWRFSHMVTAALIGSAYFMMGIAAWRLLRFPGEMASQLMLKSALILTLFAVPLQMVTGDLHGENTLKYQPTKLAAMEGSWQPPPQGEGEPLRLFAWPDQQAQRNVAEISVPDVASLYLRHNLTDHIKSLSEFPRADQPPVAPVFFAFRIMIGLGLLMLVTSLVALLQHRRGRLSESSKLLRWLVCMTPSGFTALIAGWVVTEVGRQPWTVYGILRTSDSVSTLSLTSTVIIFGLILVVYASGFTLGLIYLLRHASAPIPEKPGMVAVALKTPN